MVQLSDAINIRVHRRLKIIVHWRLKLEVIDELKPHFLLNCGLRADRERLYAIKDSQLGIEKIRVAHDF